MTSRIFKPIFAVIVFAITVAFVTIPAAPANAQPATANASIQTSEVSKRVLANVVDMLDLADNHGAVVMTTAFGGQGLSYKDHRLVTLDQLRSTVDSRFTTNAENPLARITADVAYCDRFTPLKSLELKPPATATRTSRFNFTPSKRPRVGARDAVIN